MNCSNCKKTTGKPILWQGLILCPSCYDGFCARLRAQDTGSPTSEAIIQNIYRENADNLRWWKEGYADGYPAGFDAGREYQLEQ